MAGMIFDLNNVNGTAITRLKAWGIYTVAFKGVELMSGKNKDGNTWKAMKIKFAGDEGIFEPMIFCPGDKGGERVSGESNGKKWELPSALEQLKFTVSHLVTNIAPDLMEKVAKAVSGITLPDEFEKLVDVLNRALAKQVNKQVKIKLVGDKNGYATLPSFVNINKEGDAYISNNWLGDTVAFTDYELKKRDAQKNAKPTTPTEDLDTADVDTSDNSDLDFDV